MTYPEALKVLSDRSEAHIELGLERVQAVLKALGDPHEKVPAVHVAGTNAKGSVCALLASVLRAAGLRTGLYTSPHLLEVRERIRVDGEMIPEADFARLLELVLKTEGASRLTYFELVTVVAFLHFAEAKAGAIVLETGLGGRLDATNVVTRPALTIITTVDFDHTQILGGTLAEIAAEKAGILKDGVPLVCGVENDEALGVIQAAAFDKLVSIDKLEGPLPVQAVRVDWADGLQLIQAPGYGEIFLRLLGRHQLRNAVVVLKAVEVLKTVFPALGPEAVEVGFKQVEWPGRFEVRTLDVGGTPRTLILDGAHNVEAARSFARALGESPFSQAWLIAGFLKDKDVAGILKELRPVLGKVILVPPSSPRALPADEAVKLLKEVLPHVQVKTASGAAEALALWRAENGANDRCAAVVGSFYLVADALRALGAAP